MNFFDKIRRKPEAARRRYALFISGLITGIIFIFWAVVWREMEVAGPNGPAASTTKNPIQSLTEVFTGGIGQLKEQYGSASSTWGDFSQNLDFFTSSTTAPTTTTSTYSTTTLAQ